MGCRITSSLHNVVLLVTTLTARVTTESNLPPANAPSASKDTLVVLQCRDVLVTALSELRALLVVVTLSFLVAGDVLLFILVFVMLLVLDFLLRV